MLRKECGGGNDNGYGNKDHDCWIYKNQERQMKTLIRMLAWMEICGSIGHTTSFFVNYDGDGPARLTFDFGDYQEEYDDFKESLFEVYKKTKKDHKHFNFD